jgi:predicted phage-related endonuclease
MTFGKSDSVWTKKGSTLSDKSARKEFGLTQEEIIEAIKAGKLQYRQNNVFGNPYLRLIRSEVESLVNEKYGHNYLKKKQLKKELTQTKRDLKKLKAQVTSLEQRKPELQTSLDECE